MARIAGINIPLNKHISIALTSIYGIGRVRASKICDIAAIDPSTKVRDISESEIETLRGIVAAYTIEGDLRRDIAMNY